MSNMNEIIEKIKSSKHIEIVSSSEKLSLATALYTYIMTQHKKASLVINGKKVDRKFSFLPWYDKIKSTNTPSADLTLVLRCSATELFYIFKSNNIKINKKIATSLYSAFLVESEGFKSSKVDGTLFAICGELIELGAEYKVATEVILNQISLSELRLKSLMLKEMKLVDGATTSQFYLKDKMLKESGADLEIAKKIILEGLRLPYVKKTTLISEDLKLIIKIEKEI